MKKILNLSVFLLCLAGCSSHIDMKKLLGTYHISNSSSETIMIVDDHTYKHVFTEHNGHVSENNGTWTYDSRTEQISFNNFVSRSYLPAGTWVSRVRITSKGEINLIYSSEENLFYFKK